MKNHYDTAFYVCFGVIENFTHQVKLQAVIILPINNVISMQFSHFCQSNFADSGILKYFFESYFCDYEELPKFEKLWNIDKYTPSTDTDPVNQLCLAVYALIETMKPYNDEVIPKGTFRKCLDYAYELTEGKHELNNAVIMAGAFAGIYCITLD